LWLEKNVPEKMASIKPQQPQSITVAYPENEEIENRATDKFKPRSPRNVEDRGLFIVKGGFLSAK